MRLAGMALKKDRVDLEISPSRDIRHSALWVLGRTDLS